MSNEAIFIDLDEAIADREDRPVVAILHGEKLEFPGQAPGHLVYEILRIMGDDGNVALSQVPALWNTMIGEERLRTLFDKGITWDQLLLLQNELLGAWGITGASEEGAQEGPPAE